MFTIGKASEQSGVNIETIRWWASVILVRRNRQTQVRAPVSRSGFSDLEHTDLFIPHSAV